MFSLFRTACFALVAVAAVACSSSSTGSSGSSAAGASSGPPLACEDMAVAVSKAAERCGQDYDANYKAFGTAAGGCPNIIQVRDESELRGTCIPAFATIACSDLVAGRLDPSCKGQLLHKTFAPTLGSAPASPAFFATEVDSETESILPGSVCATSAVR